MQGIETINAQNKKVTAVKPTTFGDVTNVFFRSNLARIYSLKSQEVVRWNKARGLNDVPFSVELEGRLLDEELQELEDAFATDTVDVVLDSWADILFVSFGTVGKLRDKPIDSDTYRYVKNSLDRVPPLRLRVLNHLIENFDFNPNNFDQLELTVFNIVINANNQKGKATLKGKILKDENFVAPEADIFQAFKKINAK